MRARALWQIGGVLGLVLILLAGWFLFVSPRYDSVGTNDRLRADVERQNAALESAISEISTVDVAELEDQVAVLNQLVPVAVSEPEMIRQFAAAASATNSLYTGTTFETPALFVAMPEGPGSAPLPIDPADIQAASEAGLIVVPFTTTASGTSKQLIPFADAIQASGRLFLVQAIEFGVPDEQGFVGVTIHGLAFVLPPDAEAQ